jgi:hypothetical protein
MLILFKAINLLADGSAGVIPTQLGKEFIVDKIVETPKLSVIDIHPGIHHLVGDAKRLPDRHVRVIMPRLNTQ